MTNRNVAILGASDKTDRYSYQALVDLQSYGYRVYPIHNRIRKINSVDVYPSVESITDEIGTLTMYVGKAISDGLTDSIISMKPARIVFNPGSENPELKKIAVENGIEVVEGCTLVMLRTGTF